MWRLQRGADAECRFFRSFADKAHYRGKGGTRQGIYVVAPSGKLLGSVNSLDADAVGVLLERSLREWRRLPDADRRLPPDADLSGRRRWEDSFPRSGLVLTATVRDLPADANPKHTPAVKWNRDHVWFTKDEARGWIPEDRTVGATRRIPDVIGERLARFHLVDTVRGQSLPFAKEEIVSIDVMTEIMAHTADVIRLRIAGATHAVARGAWIMGDNDWKTSSSQPRGITATLLGYATYDVGSDVFTEFDLVAVGRRWGATQNNGRRDDDASGAIGFVFSLAPHDGAERVPPAFIDVYNADWVVHASKQ